MSYSYFVYYNFLFLESLLLLKFIVFIYDLLILGVFENLALFNYYLFSS